MRPYEVGPPEPGGGRVTAGPERMEADDTMHLLQVDQWHRAFEGEFMRWARAEPAVADRSLVDCAVQREGRVSNTSTGHWKDRRQSLAPNARQTSTALRTPSS